MRKKSKHQKTEKTLGCFEFFFLHTLACVPGLLADRRSSTFLTDLSVNAHPSFVSSCLSFFLSPSTLSIHQTFNSLCCFCFYPKRVVAGSTIKTTANKFQGYKETPVFIEMLNTPMKPRQIDPHIVIMVQTPKPI